MAKTIAVDPAATTLLLADWAELRETNAEPWGFQYDPRYHWIKGWADLYAKNTLMHFCISWEVEVPVAGDYSLAIVYSCAPGSGGSEYEIVAGDSKVTGKVRETTGWLDGWRNFVKEELSGTLHLPAGVSTITMRATKRPDSSLAVMVFHKLELIPLAAKEAIAATKERAMKLRASTDWFVDAGYGLMFHWTTQVYPRRGPQKPFPDAVNDFDVNAFADMVEETGAGYVTFFASHAVQWWPAPIQAVEKILPGRTCQRDLIGDMADALNQRGIKLMLYYIPSDIHKGDETQFYDNFCNILTEVGQRYGKKVVGYWFDFGQPDAPFERLDKAAKAGNPDRIIAWNSWIYPKLTDFQEYYAGEFGGSLMHPPEGYFEKGGPASGLQAHGLIWIDDPWIHTSPDTDIAPPLFTNQQLINYVKACIAKKLVITVNLGIYQDGTISPATLEQMKALRKAIRGK